MKKEKVYNTTHHNTYLRYFFPLNILFKLNNKII